MARAYKNLQEGAILKGRLIRTTARRLPAGPTLTCKGNLGGTARDRKQDVFSIPDKTKGLPVPLAVPTTRQWDHIQNSARKNTGK